MAAAVYVVMYENHNGNYNTEHISATTAQNAVDYVRKWEGKGVRILTVAKVVSNWK